MKELIKETLDKLQITKISVFDFDATLIDTPLPEEGKKIWLEKTGKPWPHVGWWGRADSLDQTIFDMTVVASVKKTYDEETGNPHTLMVMMTGRIKSNKGDLSSEVKAILDTKGFHFDKYLYNYGGDTLHVKIKHLNNLLAEYPKVEDVLLNDDRLKHIPAFEEWCKAQVDSGRLKRWKINVVPSNHHGE